MDWGSLFNGIGSALGKGASAIGQGIGGLAGGIGNMFNSGMSGLNSMSGGLSQNAKQMYGASGPGSWGQSQLNGGGMSSMFGKPNMLGGLAGMFGSQLIGNPKTPALPQSLTNFQNQALQGGTPLQQQANQYNSTLLSGQNTAANDAATHSLDLNYQEQLRQLQGTYKSLRPGTDITSDTTYQRDLNNLNDMYTRQKAGVLAQQQQGAAQFGLQSGTEAANQQMAGIEQEIQKQQQDWAAQYQKQSTLRNSLMGLFGNQATGGMYGLGNMFQNMFKNQGQAS